MLPGSMASYSTTISLVLLYLISGIFLFLSLCSLLSPSPRYHHPAFTYIGESNDHDTTWLLDISLFKNHIAQNKLTSHPME